MKTNEEPEREEHLPFARRMHHIPKSFIREMLKTAESRGVISFAGGLPDEKLIPTKALTEAFQSAVQRYGDKLFQYANSEGFLPLREWIARRYREQYAMEVSAGDILITNGSQQAIDLLGKVFIEKGDHIVIEQPGYLGAIQSLMHYEPGLVGVPIDSEGIDTQALAQALDTHQVKMMHLIPNFQNPSGVSYSLQRRHEVLAILEGRSTLLVEDDPYGELYFDDFVVNTPIKKYLGARGVLLGSFSKTLSPGMRLGWMVASPAIMDKLVIAKQASDLHTNNLAQMMTYEYLVGNDYEAHLYTIRNCYRGRRDCMVNAMERYWPGEVSFSIPQGGMFLWCRLPEGISATRLVQLTMDAGVVMVPGSVFFTEKSNDQCFRMNFSKSTEQEIERGVKIIGDSIAYLNSKNKVYHYADSGSAKAGG